MIIRHLDSIHARTALRTPLAVALAAALGMTAISGLAQASTFKVMSAGDAGIGDGTCSSTCTLRDAVLAANANPGADTITFDSSLSGHTIVLDIAGKRHISAYDNLTIEGPGADQLTVSGGDVANASEGGILNIPNADLSISGITLANGNSGGNGGALNAEGNLTLSGVAIENNHSHSFGGGISHSDRNGIFTIIDSTISGNDSDGGGGGIGSNYSSAVVLRDSTVSGNSATGNGGGIYSRANLTISNSTISGNTGNHGGGFWLASYSVAMTNDILANNVGSNRDAFYVQARGHSITITANYTLIEGSFNATLAGSHNIIGQDPQLGPLRFNGGSTRTMALLPGSLAIDAGDNDTCEAKDQRGMSRPYDGDQSGTATCDMGAVEVYADDLDRIFDDGFD